MIYHPINMQQILLCLKKLKTRLKLNLNSNLNFVLKLSNASYIPSVNNLSPSNSTLQNFTQNIVMHLFTDGEEGEG